MEKPKDIDKVINSASLEKYGLKFAGTGAENVCFEIKGSTKKLIKVDTDVLRRKLLKLLDDPKFKYLPAALLNQEDDLNKYNEQEKQITEIFGSDHVLNRGVFKSKIPLDRDSVISILGKYGNNLTEKIKDEEIYEIEMLMHTQLIAKELKDPKKYQTKKFSTDVITHDSFKRSKNISEALQKIEEHIDTKFIPEVKKDEKYINVIKEITEKIIQYTKKTGLMLDIFGSHNITLFTNEDGHADYHLVDVILPSSLASISAWGKSIKEDKNFDVLRHAYTYYYAIKSLAEKMDIKEKLELQDLNYFKGAEIPTGDWPEKSK